LNIEPKDKTVLELEGKELLSKIKELGARGKKEKAIACGYTKVDKSGNARVKLSSFLEAVAVAEGLLPREKKKKRGNKPSFVTTVQANGNLLIGNCYTETLKKNPGDKFCIKVTKKRIVLTPYSPEQKYSTLSSIIAEDSVEYSEGVSLDVLVENTETILEDFSEAE